MFLLFNVLIAKNKSASEKLELVIFFYILPPDTRLSQSEYVLCTEEFEEY